jgi:hypothetical protein
MNIKDFIKCATSLPKNISVLVRGPHGIGKSQLVYQISKIFNLPSIERRLSQMSEGDIIGLPELEGGVTKFRPADWYMQACLAPHVLFLDELNRATPEVMQAAFQIVLDRTLNGHTLHPDTRVFAAVNVNGSYQVNEMDPALLDRFFVVDLEPTVEEWLEYAKPVVHSYMHSFIMTNNKMLNPSTKVSPGTVQPSPRSWVRLDEALKIANLYEVDIQKDKTAEQFFYCMTVGLVGTEASIAFTDFVKNMERQVSALDVLDAWEANQQRVNDLGQEKWNIISEKIIDFMSETVLTEEQCKNLGKYFWVIPAELRIAFWTTCAGKHIECPPMDANIKAMHIHVVDSIIDAVKAPEEAAKEAAELAAVVASANAGATTPPAKKARAKKA